MSSDKELKEQIFKLACDTSDGTLSAIDSAHQILALIDHQNNLAKIDLLKSLLHYANNDDMRSVPPTHLEHLIAQLQAKNKEKS